MLNCFRSRGSEREHRHLKKRFESKISRNARSWQRNMDMSKRSLQDHLSEKGVPGKAGPDPIWMGHSDEGKKLMKRMSWSQPELELDDSVF